VQHRTRLVAEVAAVGVAWGVMYALYPIGLARSGPLWLAALRFWAFLAGALLFALAKRIPLLPTSNRDRAAIAAYAAFNVVLHNVGLMAGTRHVPVAIVSIATGLNPLLTLLLARMLLPGVRIPPLATLGILAGLAGVALLGWHGGTGGASIPWGWALVVVGGVLAWSLGSVALKAAGSTMHPVALAVWASLLGATVLQAGALALEPAPRIDLPYVGTVLFAGLVGGLAAFALWTTIVREHGPQRANLASYVSPVAASLTAWALLGQPLRPIHAVAYVLVALGLSLSTLASSRAGQGQPTPTPE
jgi:drug/metabolite transporter (DMT)-like permease